jgi:hypothetical protein
LILKPESNVTTMETSGLIHSQVLAEGLYWSLLIQFFPFMDLWILVVYKSIS